jgi:hypothetical protein
MTTETEIKAWKVGNFEILDDDHGCLGWRSASGNSPITVFDGPAWVKGDVLEIKTVGFPMFTVDSWDDIKKTMDLLPVWDRTKYYATISEHMEIAMYDCRTGERVTGDFVHEYIEDWKNYSG